ncbi:MAG TPA: hypothetical protein PLG48_06450 [Candidatus Avimonas sp.]|nr:hypothetical protein [Clostridiales bacterium]HPU59131.1 hypothetical protein [Candidatus Avimonas sp.]
MKGYSFGRHPKKRAYFIDNDLELADELSPDPFSEEEHTIIHARRFSKENKQKNLKSEENKRKQEI